MDWADAVRVLIIVLFGLTAGETGWILRKYVKVAAGIRRLLPMHVAAISASVLMLETHVGYVTAVRWGMPATWLLWYDLLAFIGVYASLVLVRLHIQPKQRVSKQISSLLNDPHEFP